ncbi:retention module-containing protein, partial [Brenneria goodwinii]|uniref:retention module-containing protein n=2 Tax=Brenneria goodwinii TaxID=1109412 RepID=UPI0036EBF427
MNNVIGIIKFVIGQVFVVALDGSQRLLVAGERIYSGEEVVTGDNGAVSITLPDGRTLDLGRDSNWSGVAGANNENTTSANNNSDVESLQSAIAQGEDPTQILEPTAAGNSDIGEAGDGGGSHTPVVLELTGQIVDPLVGYDTAGLTVGTASSSEENNPAAMALAASNSETTDSTTPPSVAITINGDGTVSFSFTKPPAGFDGNDITVANGTLSALTQDPNDPTHWSAVLTPRSDFEGEVVISVPDGSYTDENGTPGTGASSSITVDTLAPDAAISIDPITADNVVNADESNQTISVTGQVGADVQAGDTVTVTVGNETYQTTVNADGTTWSVNVPGSVLAGNSTVNATVTTSDAAGNTTTADASRGYTVDTVAPEASITIDPVTSDNTINLTESNQPQTVSGRVGNDVQAGDTVTVTVGSETYQTTVNADGSTWSISVPGEVLAGNTQIHAEVTTSDAAGNPTTAAADHSYAVDTVAPEATITIDTITADNVINAAESGQTINVTGQVGANVQAGDTVTVTVGGESYQTTVNTDGTTWNVGVPGSVLAGNSTVNATVTTVDAAGNTVTANTSHGYEVDVTAPEAEITIDTITADNVINVAESDQTINVTGQVGANVQAGDTVTVTIGDEAYQTTVNADGSTWSVGVPGSVLAGNSSVNASVTTSDAAGNMTTADASHGYGVDVTAPEATISIDTITADNVINAAESGQTINVTGQVGANVQAGDTVTVTVGGESYQTTVNADGGTWSVNVPGSVLAGNSSVNATVTTADTAGNTATANASHGYEVDVTAPEASITIDPVTSDNTINLVEANQPQTISGHVGNDVQVGDTVTVTVGGQSYQTTVTAASDGSNIWSVSVPGEVLAGNTQIHAEVTTSDSAGNPTTATADHSYAVDTVAPEAEISIDTITADNVVNAAESGQTINVTGQVGANVQAGDTVTVTVGNETYQTTVNADGSTWSVNVPGGVLAGNTSVSASVTTADEAGNTATANTSHGYDVDVTGPEASIIIDPVTADNTINLSESNQPQNITGRVGNDVQAGDTVTVTVGGQSYQTTVTAASDGSNIWSVSVPGEVLAGNTQIHAEVT